MLVCFSATAIIQALEQMRGLGLTSLVCVASHVLQLQRLTIDIGELGKGYSASGQYVQMKIGESKPGFFAIASPPGGNGVVEVLVKNQGSTAELLCQTKPGNEWQCCSSHGCMHAPTNAGQYGDFLKLFPTAPQYRTIRSDTWGSCCWIPHILEGHCAGDEVDVSPVMGKGFPIDKTPPDQFKSVIIFATGTGIGPIKALIESDQLQVSSVRQTLECLVQLAFRL